MRWMRNDTVCYTGSCKQDWPDRLEVVGIDAANRGHLGWMDCAPWADRDDKPLMMGVVYRDQGGARLLVDDSPQIVARPVPEDGQVWDVDWPRVEGHPARLPVISRAGGARGMVEISSQLDKDGNFFPTSWVESEELNGCLLDAHPVVMVNRPGTPPVRHRAPWPLVQRI